MSECLLGIVVLHDLCFSKCLFLYALFCHGAFEFDLVYIVCNSFSLKISSIYIYRLINIKTTQHAERESSIRQAGRQSGRQAGRETCLSVKNDYGTKSSVVLMK